MTEKLTINDRINQFTEQLQILTTLKKIFVVIDFFEKTQEFLKKNHLNTCMVTCTQIANETSVYYTYHLDFENEKKNHCVKVDNILKRYHIAIHSEFRTSLRDVIDFKRGRIEIPISLNDNHESFLEQFLYDTYKNTYHQWKTSMMKEQLDKLLGPLPSIHTIKTKI